MWALGESTPRERDREARERDREARERDRENRLEKWVSGTLLRLFRGVNAGLTCVGWWGDRLINRLRSRFTRSLPRSTESLGIWGKELGFNWGQR